MSRGFHSNRGGPPVDAADGADYWLAKHALGTMTARDARQFGEWLQQPAHARAYADAEALLHDAGAVAAHPEIVALRSQALRLAPRRPAPLWIAAAAACVAGCVLTAVWWRGSATAPVDLPAASPETSAAYAATHYRTAVGQQREIKLDDGTRVTLNTNSLLDVDFNKQRRDVRLVRGQALFQVAHNTAWPFVVSAGDRRITAVGTAFDVRVDADRIKVVLLEGRVKVDSMAEHGLDRILPTLSQETLTPGEQLTATVAQPVSITVADVERATSWRSGQVVFRDESLASAAAELNRYTDHHIVVRDPRLSSLKVSGVFSVARPENFVAAVTALYAVKATPLGPDLIELSWRDGN